MTFTSNIFLIGLLPWLILLFRTLCEKGNKRKILIFVANSIFYIWGGVGAFLVVCGMSFVTWLFCKAVRKQKNKLLLGIGCTVLVAPLLAVKYTGFLINNINGIFNLNMTAPDLLVPIGISFFTFEAISCFCDVYKGTLEESPSLLDVYLYLTFFPTVTSGPIMRFADFKKGCEENATTSEFTSGIERIAIGLCKKVLVADKIAILADYYFDGVAAGKTYSCLGLWIGSIAYTLQLYFDFSGYSDMAIGIGQLLGFRIPENFKNPYQANSIQDFWKRWHISLSQWFRDYIYIPLGGNRCSIAKHIRNLLVVWLLTGIWHGANWTFILWGIGYFILLTIEKYVPFMKKIGDHWYGHLYVLFFVNLLWVPFRAASISVAGRFVAGMFGFHTASAIEEKAMHFLPFLIVIIALCFPWDRWFEKYKNKKWFCVLRGILLLALVGFAVCAVINASYIPYIYGNF